MPAEVTVTSGSPLVSDSHCEIAASGTRVSGATFSRDRLYIWMFPCTSSMNSWRCANGADGGLAPVVPGVSGAGSAWTLLPRFSVTPEPPGKPPCTLWSDSDSRFVKRSASPPRKPRVSCNFTSCFSMVTAAALPPAPGSESPPPIPGSRPGVTGSAPSSPPSCELIARCS